MKLVHAFAVYGSMRTTSLVPIKFEFIPRPVIW